MTTLSLKSIALGSVLLFISNVVWRQLVISIPVFQNQLALLLSFLLLFVIATAVSKATLSALGKVATINGLFQGIVCAFLWVAFTSNVVVAILVVNLIGATLGGYLASTKK